MPTKNLTQQLCDSVNYPAGLDESTYVIWDEKVTGFGLRIAPGGTKSYVIMYRCNGRQRMKKLCPHDRVRLARARAEAKQRLGDAALGDDPFPKVDEKSTVTVEELCEEWIEKYAEVHRTNVDTPTRRLRQNVITAIGNKPADEVTVADVAKIAQKKGIEEGKKVEANRVVALLGSVYRWGAKRELVPKDVNPTRGVDRFREESRSVILGKEEFKPFWEAVEAEKNKHIRGAVKLMLLTGARKGEILSSRWEDLDRDARVLLLRDTKNGTDHRLPLSEAAMAVVDELEAIRPNRHPYLICGHKNGTHLKSLRKGWKRILKRSGINKDLDRHDLRRTFITYLTDLKHPQPVVKWLVNHKLEGVAGVYTHLHAGSDAVRDAVEDYGQWVMRQVKGKESDVIELAEAKQGRA